MIIGTLDFVTIVTIVVVAAFVGAGIWQFVTLSRPLRTFIGDVGALESVVERADVLDDEALRPWASMAVGAAVVDVVAASSDGRRESSRAIINDSLIAADVPTLRRFESVPGQIVGVGLALTFLLLAIAISQAASALTQTGTSLEKPMQALLQTAGSKFAVSIAAISVSLILVWRRTRLLIEAEITLTRLAVALDRRLPLTLKSDETLSLARQQAATLSRIESALQEAEAPGAVLSAALAAALAPVAVSINTMGERVANTNAEALERMVAAFTKELGGATLRYNEQLAEILRETKDALAAAPQQILKAATLTEEMLDVAADKTRSALEVAGIAFTATADKLAAIALQAQRAEERLDVALDKATANADAATARLAGLAEQAQQATTTADTATARMAGLTGQVEKATTTVDAATARMAGLAGQVEKATTTADSALKEASAMGVAFTDARLAAEAMQTDTRDWRDGMGEVDRNVSTIIEKIRGLLPEGPEPSSTEPPKASPWEPKPRDGSSEAAE